MSFAERNNCFRGLQADGKSLSRGKGFRKRVAYTKKCARAFCSHRAIKPLESSNLRHAKFEY